MARVLTVVICALVGIASLSFSCWHARHTIALLRHGTRTMGHIAQPTAHPLVAFTDSSGKPVEFVQNGFLTRPKDAEVPVIYLAQDPAGTARANTVPCMWWGVFWMLPVGAATMFGAIAGERKLIFGKPQKSNQGS